MHKIKVQECRHVKMAGRVRPTIIDGWSKSKKAGALQRLGRRGRLRVCTDRTGQAEQAGRRMHRDRHANYMVEVHLLVLARAAEPRHSTSPNFTIVVGCTHYTARLPSPWGLSVTDSS
ncbi:hypothetical protein J6590_033464 [Homalodisca vitripennis]|nr:hypothetical protein J6590_033464 [Homalodisca vitripennis]